MGLIGRVIGVTGAVREVGAAVTGVAEVFVGNRAERDAAEQTQRVATLGQYAAEFAGAQTSRFDAFMDGLNRLPRPLLVIGTLGLFAYAMAAPAGFSVRMQGLALVPEPLWWLLGAIVSFYFGARELHYRRDGVGTAIRQAIAGAGPASTADAPGPMTDAEPVEFAPPLALFRPVPAVPPTTAPSATAPVAMRASDPQFNAAVEEWRRQRP